MRVTKKLKRGFTLVELMIVVAIVGVLAALAIYGVRKYVLNAKTAEARNALGQMSKDTSTAFSREAMLGAVLTLGNSTGIVHRLCDSSTAVPSGIPTAMKYQSTPAEWAAGGQLVGWPCLRFSMQDPHYYQYQYVATDATGTGTFTAFARGNLDGDSATSVFSILGSVQTQNGERVVTIAPAITEADPDE